MTKDYQPLARKYRPQSFNDLIGQEVLNRIMTNAIQHDKIPHAMLLTGIRGVGKTTAARIIARALNCVRSNGDGALPNIEPCGVCQHCIAISESRHPDVLEMDAASHTSVNDIRSIIENIAYQPISARSKVYIIDEVHMLSSSAFNALLKTLEEPPSHTKFIFATTEINKIPLTILSRCQKFYLKRISIDLLVDHYSNIIQKENVTADKEALYLIAKAADGSVRDGLSILDQAIALSGYQNISESIVADMLGLGSQELIYELFDAIACGDLKPCLNLALQLYQSGADPFFILKNLLELVHNVTLFKNFPERLEIDLSETHKKYIEKFAVGLSNIFLSRAWQMLLKGVEELENAILIFESLEMLLIRITYANTVETPEDILKVLKGTLKNPENVLSKPETELMPEPVSAPISENHVKSEDSIKINTIHDIISLFSKHNEMLLCYTVQNDISIISIENSTITLSLLEDAPRNIALDIEKKLFELTNQKWCINVVTECGGLSLTSIESIEANNKRRDIINSPLVKDVLDKISGIEIAKVEF